MVDTVEFKKRAKHNNSTLYFYIKVKEKEDNINYRKIYKLMDNVFDNLKSYDNLKQIVSYIRTIFKQFEECYLEIKIFNNEFDNAEISFTNTKLMKYEANKLIQFEEYDNHKDVLHTKYDEEGLNFSITDKNNKCIIEGSNLSDSIKYITEEANKINALKNITPVELNYDEKKLCEVYKIFYKENPDFSSKYINIKVQAMMSILSEHGITLNRDYGFAILSKSKMPISVVLSEMVNNLVALGEIDSISEKVKLSSEAIRIIDSVGKIVREYSKGQIENIIKISSIYHINKYNLSYGSDIQKIANISNCSIEEVNSCLVYVKRLDESIY